MKKYWFSRVPILIGDFKMNSSHSLAWKTTSCQAQTGKTGVYNSSYQSTSNQSISPYQSISVHTSPYQSTHVQFCPYQSIPVHISPHMSTSVSWVPLISWQNARVFEGQYASLLLYPVMYLRQRMRAREMYCDRSILYQLTKCIHWFDYL